LLHPRALGAFDRYAYPLFPLLNASLAQASEIAGHARAKSRLQEVACVEEELTVQVRKLIRTSKHQMLQNAAYCVGILAAQGDNGVALEAFKLYPMLLTVLQPRCRVDAAVRDNAVLVRTCLVSCHFSGCERLARASVSPKDWLMLFSPF
jgi:hypothetical protein